MRGWLVVVLAGACGRLHFDAVSDAAPDATPEQLDGYASGTRLKLVWYQFEDGTRSWKGLYDSLRGEACTVEPWSDGELYCTPEAVQIAYSDAACTQPIGGGGAAYYIEISPCDVVEQLSEPGAPSAIAGVYQLDPVLGLCNGPFPDSSAQQLGTPVTTPELAHTPPAIETGTGRITLRTIATADGLRLPWTLHDVQLSNDCFTEITSSGRACLVPDDTAVPPYTSDAACTQDLGFGLTGCPKPVTEVSTGCSSSYYELGAEYSGAVYGDTPTGCKLATVPAGYTVYQLASAITLAELDHTAASAPDRRVQLEYDGADGVRLRSPLLYDRALGVECTPGQATDGVVRCLPAGPIAASVFSDAGCTNPITVTFADPCSNAPAPTYALSTEFAPTRTTVYAIGAAYGATVYAGSPAACIAFGTGAYLVGAAIDPTTFASATLVTDP